MPSSQKGVLSFNNLTVKGIEDLGREGCASSGWWYWDFSPFFFLHFPLTFVGFKQSVVQERLFTIAGPSKQSCIHADTVGANLCVEFI